MRTTIPTLTSLAILLGVLALGPDTAQAGGYYYRARSLYVTPPVYAYLPVFGQPPIVVYEPVATYPAPVAGYYGPVAAPVVAPVPVPAPAVAPVVGYSAGYAAPAPAAAYAAPSGVGRVRERQVTTPFHTR